MLLNVLLNGEVSRWPNNNPFESYHEKHNEMLTPSFCHRESYLRYLYDPLRGSLFNLNYLHHFITIVVDDLDGDFAGFGLGKWPGFSGI